MASFTFYAIIAKKINVRIRVREQISMTKPAVNLFKEMTQKLQLTKQKNITIFTDIISIISNELKLLTVESIS